MKILFVSKDLIAGNLAHLLKKEGHQVKLYIEEKDARKSFDNLVPKTNDWRKELKWVGTDGLIIFDDCGYGRIQDRLREEGYTVFGGSEFGDMLETDREFGHKAFTEAGLKTVELKNFFDIRSAINYVKANPKRWVVKFNNHSVKSLTYTGNFKDSRDVVNILETYDRNQLLSDSEITLQEYIDGIEMGVGRFFNGTDWVGPIEINFEHTRFFPGDIGPVTTEMGTLAWYESNEKNKLFQDTLQKMKPFLQKCNFRGDFSINCIVNKDGALPLEATARFGTPIVHLQTELHESPWGEFLYAVAKGEQYDLKWKKGYGVVVMLAAPPFPYTYKLEKHSLNNIDIYFDERMKKDDMEHVHFEEVALREETDDQYFISDSRGYIMYVTGVADTVEQARNKVYRIVRNIHIPKVFYRHDIGAKFVRQDYEKLVKWGYLNKKISAFIFSDEGVALMVGRR